LQEQKSRKAKESVSTSQGEIWERKEKREERRRICIPVLLERRKYILPVLLSYSIYTTSAPLLPQCRPLLPLSVPVPSPAALQESRKRHYLLAWEAPRTHSPEGRLQGLYVGREGSREKERENEACVFSERRRREKTYSTQRSKRQNKHAWQKERRKQSMRASQGETKTAPKVQREKRETERDTC
jgi:hypothetical protein